MGLPRPFVRRPRPALVPLDPQEQRVLDELRARRERAEQRKAGAQAEGQGR